MIRQVSTIVVTVLVAVGGLAVVAAEEPKEAGVTATRSTRQEFAHAMAKIKEGMTEKEVLSIIGQPDDIRTEYDPGGISTTNTKKIWNYGAAGHLTFGTLGSVYIDFEGKAQYMFGGHGEPPPARLFSEAELRSLLRLIDNTPSYNAGWSYDPLAIIRIVNALQPLGKEKALAAIDEYLRVSSDFHCTAREGVFLVLRVLFDVPHDPGYMPAMMVGAPWPAGPSDPKQLPRFPIVLVDDVPLLLVSGYMLAGEPEQPESHVAYFRKNGQIRNKLLRPGNSPLQLLDLCVTTARWPSDATLKHRKAIVACQLLALVDSVYRSHNDEDDYRFSPSDGMDGQWKTIEDAVTKFDIQWSAEKCCYTFRDGTCLPQAIPTIYQRKIWKPTGLPGDTSVIFERKSRSRVSVGLVWSGKANEKMSDVTLDVLAVKDKSHPFAEMKRSSMEASVSDETYSSQWCEIVVAEGTEIQARLKVGKQEQLSIASKP